MIYTTRPVNFSPRFEVVSCFIQVDDRFLLLLRQDGDKLQPNVWGLPAGKKEKKEKELDAMLREIEEETGLKIKKPKLQQHHTLYVRYSEYDFTYYPFHARFTEEPEIELNPVEHKDFRWVTAEEAFKMKLIKDLDECIKVFFKMRK
ncbi:MAG: NUDIX hydrolase [Candidatus Gracilibacteria bacterium]